MTLLRANLRSSARRLWAAGAAVAVATAFVVAGLLLVESLVRTVTEEAESEAGGADLVIDSEWLID
ncbi:hypothetical protein [Nesterenkonia sp.]|uniref:hypothetical protein n=1 Tax=Nesterenkonia sp. TaxID=704201 RepID=UPI0026368BD5|nr:hypothetical protein [Nesterenkonia sp.]